MLSWKSSLYVEIFFNIIVPKNFLLYVGNNFGSQYVGCGNKVCNVMVEMVWIFCNNFVLDTFYWSIASHRNTELYVCPTA